MLIIKYLYVFAPIPIVDTLEILEKFFNGLRVCFGNITMR